MDPNASVHPFARRGLLSRAAPFVGLTLLAFAVLPLPPKGDTVQIVAAQACTVALFCAILLAPWSRLPGWTQAVPPLAYLVIIGLLRHAEGGAPSAASPLVMVPVFWLALYGTARQLGATIAGIAILFIAPVLLLESGRYPATEWERAILWTATAAIVGYTVQGLVRRIQRQAAALDELARTDEVTGLPNRRAWEEALTYELGVATQHDQPLSIAVLELDDFETFLERHGRQEAEKLLKISGLAWRGRLPANVLLARSGPHDFRIVLSRTSREAAVAVVDGLRDGTPAMQTLSAGVAQWNRDEPPEALVARADSALDEARHRGKGATVTAYEAVRDERDEVFHRLLERGAAG